MTTRWCQREQVIMIGTEAGELLTPAMAIDGFRRGCLIDASAGMILAMARNRR